MELREAEAACEAILFSMGKSVDAASLAKALELDQKTTENVVHRLMEKYQQEGRGIQIIELNHAFQMCTRKEYYEYLIRLVMQPKKPVLTEVMLETLSIIAYKQPVTKMEIEKIRGVKCDHAVNRLMEFDLICELGRLDVPGRPILLGTTEEFLRSFGVQEINDLPRIDPVRVADFKAEAEEEAQLKLNI